MHIYKYLLISLQSVLFQQRVYAFSSQVIVLENMKIRFSDYSHVQLLTQHNIKRVLEGLSSLRWRNRVVCTDFSLAQRWERLPMHREGQRSCEKHPASHQVGPIYRHVLHNFYPACACLKRLSNCMFQSLVQLLCMAITWHSHKKVYVFLIDTEEVESSTFPALFCNIQN